METIENNNNSLNLLEENNKLKSEISILKNQIDLEKLSQKVSQNFRTNSENMERLNETFKKGFEKAYYNENLQLKKIISQYENEALEETKGLTFEGGADFINFVNTH